MDKEWLEKQHSLGLSQRKIAELAGVSTPTIRAWFKKHNITARSISESLQLNPSKSSWNEERRIKLVRQNLPYDNATTLELSRFCIHPNYQKHNLGSWFLSKAIKMLPTHIKTIISYSDLTHNHNGGLYKASNFKIDHIVKPDYWYARENGWILHKKTVYNKAKSAGLRESEYAKQENLKKVKGKEKICFRYDI